jgi:hypothetical protein
MSATSLDLFAQAANWKRYWASQIADFLGTRIAEIGAGIGANVALLGKPRQAWTCIEPDLAIAARIEARSHARELSFSCRVPTKTCADLETGAYDSMLYIDVLERIADVGVEVNAAAQRLRPGGHLITCPPRTPTSIPPSTPRSATIGDTSARRRLAGDALRAGQQLRLHCPPTAAFVACAGQQQHGALSVGRMGLVKEAHAPAATALDAQEPRGEGAERLDERERQWWRGGVTTWPIKVVR